MVGGKFLTSGSFSSVGSMTVYWLELANVNSGEVPSCVVDEPMDDGVLSGCVGIEESDVVSWSRSDVCPSDVAGIIGAVT